MHSAIFTFKCSFNMAPNSFNDYFKLHQPKYLVRNSKMKLLVLLIIFLHEHVRLETSLSSFKSKLLNLFAYEFYNLFRS